MNTETKKNTKTKVSFSAKIPLEIKEKIKQIAKEQDRSPSQVVSRLLASHPEIATSPSSSH